jgi:hypothetical protein
MYKKIVKEVLIDFQATRDDDQSLYAIILDKLNFNTMSNSAYDLIRKVRAKELPSLDTITRARRMVQMETPTLRGNEWDARHGIKIQKALTDLGYVVNS